MNTVRDWLVEHPPLLARELGLADADAVLAVAEEVYGDRLDAAARFFVEELFA